MGLAIGKVRTFEYRGRVHKTGIFKAPVPGRVQLTELGFVGDERAESGRLGDANHAVYAFPSEHYEFWSKRLGATLSVGQFGENLVVSGMLETQVRIGDVFRIGSAELEVAEPCIPSRALDVRMGFAFARTFLESRRVGYYLRVLSPGSVETSDAITLLSSDPASPTIDDFLRISQVDCWDAEGLEGLLKARRLPAAWRDVLEVKLERANRAAGWYGLRRLRVSGYRKDEHSTTLSLVCERGKPLPPLSPGQVLPLSFAVEGRRRTLRHVYPVTFERSAQGAYRISALTPVRDEGTPDGRLSSRLPRELRERDAVLAGAPRGGLELRDKDLEEALLVSQGIGLTQTIALLRALPVAVTRRLEVVHFRGGEPLPLLERELAVLAREYGCLCRLQDGGSRGAQVLDMARLTSVVASGPRAFVEQFEEKTRKTPFRGFPFD